MPLVSYVSTEIAFRSAGGAGGFILISRVDTATNFSENSLNMNTCFLLVVLLLILSCTKNSNSPLNSNNLQIIPLKVGNSWTYTQMSFNEDGSVKDSTSIVETVTSTEIVNGTIFFHVTDSL